MIGGLSPGSSDNVSIFPSDNRSSALSNNTSQLRNGVTSKSRLAIVVGRPENEFSREYRILALAAGTTRIG
jgi:hypothetical protein